MLKKPVVIHPFLLAVFPALYLFANNLGKFQLKGLFVCSALTLILAALFYIALKKVSGDCLKSGLALSLFLLIFFSYGHLLNALKTTGIFHAARRLNANPAVILLYASGFVFLFGIWRIIVTRKDTGVITNLLNITAAILIAISLFNVVIYETLLRGEWLGKEAGEDIKASSGVSARPRVLPDIYYIVVDAYAGDEVLKKLYGYDNTAFTGYLAEKGFRIIPNARSNYRQTVLSLASSLNFGYLDKLAGKRHDSVFDWASLTGRLITKNRVSRFLRQHGYRITAFSSWYSGMGMDSADTFIALGYGLNDFYAAFIGTTPIPVLSNLLGLPDSIVAAYTDMILHKFIALSDVKSYGAGSPAFVLCYIEAPHPPFVLGQAEGRPNVVGWHGDSKGFWAPDDGKEDAPDFIRRYIDQLKYVNGRLKTAINAIMARSKTPPIIILQSDHGPRLQLGRKAAGETEVRESFSILSAYYLPDGGDKLLYDGITPVNTFRVVFNGYLGARYQLLDDRSFLATSRRRFGFIDVTAKKPNT